MLAEAGIDNTLLAQAGINQYHHGLKPVSIMQYGRYIDTIESSEVPIECLASDHLKGEFCLWLPTRGSGKLSLFAVAI